MRLGEKLDLLLAIERLWRRLEIRIETIAGGQNDISTEILNFPGLIHDKSGALACFRE
jgi:hypothetical protein